MLLPSGAVTPYPAADRPGPGTQVSPARRYATVATLLLVTQIGAPRVVNAEPCEAYVAFANGIYSEKGADLARRSLKDAINAELTSLGRRTIPDECTAVAPSRSYLADLLEAANQLLESAFRNVWGWLFGRGTVSAAFEEAVVEILLRDPILEPDLQEHIALYRKVADTLAIPMIVVAHSQGNLLAKEAFRRLSTGADALDESALNRIAIIPVATPASSTVRNVEHITLYGDIITYVSLLGANTPSVGTPCFPNVLNPEAPPVLGVANGFFCHSFTESYLRGPASRRRIVDRVIDILTGSEPPPPPPPPGNQPPTAGFSMSAGSQTTIAPDTLLVAADPITGEARVTFTDQSTDPDGTEDIIVRRWETGTGELLSDGLSTFTWGFTPGRYTVMLTVVDRGGLESSTAAVVDVFRLEAIAINDAYRVNQGGVLTVPPPGVLGNDTVTPGRGLSVEFLPPFPPAGLTNAGGGGFVLDFTANPTFVGTVSFDYVVHTDFGDSNVATVTVDIRALSEAVLFHDAGLLLTSFRQPVADGRGGLVVSSDRVCAFGAAVMRVRRIRVDGSLDWETPDVTGCAAGSSIRGGIFVGAAEQPFVTTDTRLLSFDPNGSEAPPPWPFSLPANWAFADFASVDKSHRELVVDPDGSAVYTRIGQRFGCSTCPTSVRAFFNDGSDKWRFDWPSGGPGLGVILGPLDNLFTILDRELVGIGRGDGSLLCRSGTDTAVGDVVGGSAGVFIGFRREVTLFDASCVPSVVYTAASGRELNLTGYVSGVAVGAEYSTAPFDLSTARLLGVSADGGLLWRNSEILPLDNGGSLSQVSASLRSMAYLIGRDLNDGAQKVFGVDVTTGSIAFRVQTAGVCETCGVTVGQDGTVYVTDLLSTKIFRVQ